MSSPITTHVLDTSRGRAAEGMTVVLEMRTSPGTWKELSRSRTNTDGRIGNLLPDDFKLESGTYRLTFDTATYFRELGVNSFYPFVTVSFEAKEAEHYHIPLLLSPFGYSTYRGS